MTVRRSAVFGLLLAIAVLGPVLAIVSLGAYGMAIGGSTASAAASGAQLEVIPPHGLPGAAITIRGSHWPPRARVSVLIDSHGGATDEGSMRLPLRELVTSRRGEFEIKASIPAAYVPRGTRLLHIHANHENDGVEGFDSTTAAFKVDPYPNRLMVSVFDEATGFSVGGAEVVLEDSFGQVVANSTTKNDAPLFFDSMRPGRISAVVRKVDYIIGRAEIDVPAAGESHVKIRIKETSPSRLFLSTAPAGDDRAVSLIGIDRTSGLPVEELAEIPRGRWAPISDSDGRIYQGFLLPVGGDLDDEARTPAAMESLWAMGIIARRMRNAGSAYGSSVWHRYIGRSAFGDVVFSKAFALAMDPRSHLFVVDPVTGRIALHKILSLNMLPPVLAGRGTAVLFLNTATSSVHRIDLATGDETELVTWLGVEVSHAVQDPLNENALVITTTQGEIYRLDLDTGVLVPLSDEKSAILSIAVIANGRLLVSRLMGHRIDVMNLSTGRIDAVIPARIPADWLWVDPTGPFIYAFSFAEPASISVELIDAVGLNTVHTLRFPKFHS